MTYAPVIVGALHTDNSSVPVTGISKQNDTPVLRGTKRFWLDGSVIFNGTCLRRTSHLDQVLPDTAASWSINEIASWWSQSARNPGALYVEDVKLGWSACLPDPLGGALAFSYRSSGLSLISTDIVELVRVAETHGQTLTKDPLFQVERLMLGNGGLTNASYKDVKTAEPFQYFVMEGNQIFTRDYGLLATLKPYSLHELFQKLRSDVQSSVQAIADSDSKQVISHLTGGFDSRLVLASILDLGVQDRVKVFCSGPEGSTDRIVADGLTRKYSLNRVNGAGLSSAPTTNMSERLMAPLFVSGGITNTGPFGRETSVPVSAMGGGYGEVLRTFFGNRNIMNSEGQIDNEMLVNSFMPSARSATSYVSQEAVNQISVKLIEKFHFLSKLYDDIDFVGDAFYTHNRNRYHIGQTSLLWSRVGSRFDPLYSVAGFEISRRLTQQSRGSNVVGHDLMESFRADLLSWPFDYDRYSPELLALRKRRTAQAWPSEKTTIAFEEAISPSVEADSPFLAKLRQINASEPVMNNAERKSKIAEANKLGVNFWQIVYKTTGQELLRNSFEQSNGSALAGVVDTKYIQKLASAEALNKKELRDLYSLGGIISWLSFG